MLAEDVMPGAKAAANYIGVSPRVVYHLVEAGELLVVRKGRRLYFRRSELERAFSLPKMTPANDLGAAR